jgi:hypothetical protein
MFEWCVLSLDNETEGRVIMCPSEFMADKIMEEYTSFLRVKYPSKYLQ